MGTRPGDKGCGGGASMCEAYFLLGQNELNTRFSHLANTRAAFKGGKKSQPLPNSWQIIFIMILLKYAQT